MSPHTRSVSADMAERGFTPLQAAVSRSPPRPTSGIVRSGPSMSLSQLPLPHSTSASSYVFVEPASPQAGPSRPTTLRRIPRSGLSSEDAGGDEDSGMDQQWTAQETETLHTVKLATGKRMINQYLRLGRIGKGAYGKVYLCEEYDLPSHTSTGQYWALKEVPRAGPSKELKSKALRRPKTSESGLSVPPTPRNGRLNGLAGGHGADAGLQPPPMDDKLQTEIAIMKRCSHPNIVRLREVINDPKAQKVFFVLEYMAGGKVEWRTDESDHARPLLTVSEARAIFRDLVLGLEYLHCQGIIHRDVKPQNLLWTDESHKCVKIGDFGVSYVSRQFYAPPPSPNTEPAPLSPGFDDPALRASVGTWAFFAPELCWADSTPATTPATTPMPRRNASYGMRLSEQFRVTTTTETDDDEEMRSDEFHGLRTISPPLPGDAASRQLPVGFPIDVWAAGVTLYCMLFGRTPFQVDGNNPLGFFTAIPNKSVPVPATMGREQTPTEADEVTDLLARLLEKDPAKRITLAQVKRHPWLLRELPVEPNAWLEQTAPTTKSKVVVSQDEVRHATVPRTNREKVPGRGLRAAFRRAFDRFGKNSSNVPLSPTSTEASSRLDSPISPRGTTPFRNGRHRGLSSAAQSIAFSSAPFGQVTSHEAPASALQQQQSIAMDRKMSGSSAGSHGRDIPPPLLIPPANRPHTLDRRNTSPQLRGTSERETGGSSGKSSWFKTAVGRMRSGSRVPLGAAAASSSPSSHSHSSAVERAGFSSERASLREFEDPRTPTVLVHHQREHSAPVTAARPSDPALNAEAVIAPYSSRALRPALIVGTETPGTGTASIDTDSSLSDGDSEDEGGSALGDHDDDAAAERHARARAQFANAIHSRLVPSSDADVEDDEDGDAEADSEEVELRLRARGRSPHGRLSLF